MQLKKLELCGFKSFAGRTEIVFDRGVTCIVGPNGCGKSNVVDAMRWVLGTLSHKAVRGEEMMDVIFKGASGVAPTGFAEVSLTLDNTDRTLAIEFDEVVITRRLHRSGESEYLINRSPVRLKDVRTLLYGTGIGTDNYSIIEQGKIDRLVMSNPQERRLVFDEAAGISKYRARRHEAELRLEKVNQDLLRMQDVIREVQRELRGVRAQAGRAQRYRDLETEYRDKRKKLVLHERERIRREAVETAARCAELEKALAELETSRTERRAERERLEKELAAADARAAEQNARRAGILSKEEYLRRSTEQLAQQIEDLSQADQRNRREMEGHEEKKRDVEEREHRCREEAVAAREAFGRLEREIEEWQSRVEQAQTECRQAAEDLERKRTEAVELAHKESQYRSEAARIEEELAGLSSRLERNADRLTKAVSEREEILQRLHGVEERLSTAERELVGCQERRDREVKALELLRAERAGLEARLDDLRSEREAKIARRETLRDLELQLEGVEEGARQILRRGGEAILGTVADRIEVEASLLNAVEQALGERAGYVVCRDTEAALQAATEAGANASRIGLISLQACQRMPLERPALPAGALVRASDVVRSPEELRPIVETLLGSTWIVEDRGVALALLASATVKGTLVTRDGECFDTPGIVRLWRAGASGLLSRKAELRRLELEIEETTEGMALAQERREENEARARTCEEKLDLLRKGIYEQTVSRTEAQTEREQLEKRRVFLTDEITVLETERAELEGRRGSMSTRTVTLVQLVEEAGALRTQMESEITAQAEREAGYRVTLSHLQEEATAARVRRAQEEERVSSIEKRTAALAGELSYVQESVRNCAAQIEEIGRRQAAAMESCAREEDELARLRAEKVGVEQEIGLLEAERSARSADVERVRSEDHATEGRIREASSGLQQQRVAEGELRVREENLLQRAREEYGIDLTVPEASSEAGEAGEVNWETLSTEVEELRRKIQSFGAVNIVALDQLKELEERDQYMLGQQKDLTVSRDQLQELIRKLNQESRELFEKTLADVRTHFSEIFRKVFGGGKADIVVEEQEGVDAMDRGLEILARPPRKEVTTLRLLSGGERSLTAIALVLALFKSNPSPFCVLDEADAALDETNVGKYAALVREYTSETQFIVITHNQRTMAVGDVLYGVTMETPGISKKVKVDLRGDDKLDLVRKIAQDKADSTALPEAQSESATATAVLEEGQEPEAPETPPQG